MIKPTSFMLSVLVFFTFSCSKKRKAPSTSNREYPTLNVLSQEVVFGEKIPISIMDSFKLGPNNSYSPECLRTEILLYFFENSRVGFVRMDSTAVLEGVYAQTRDREKIKKLIEFDEFDKNLQIDYRRQLIDGDTIYSMWIVNSQITEKAKRCITDLVISYDNYSPPITLENKPKIDNPK